MVEIEDMGGMKPKEGWSNLDVLAAVGKVALQKFNKKKRKQKMMMKQSHTNESFSNHHRITKIKIPISSQNSTTETPITKSICLELQNVRREPPGPPPIVKKHGLFLDHNQRKPSWSTDNWYKKFNSMEHSAPQNSNKACLETRFDQRKCDGEKAVMKQKKQRKRKVASSSSSGPYPPPNMPLELKEIITGKGGSEVQLVIQKSLYRTDVSKGHNRLSIPLNLMKQKDFLTKEEERILKTRKDDRHFEGIECLFIEPSRDESSLVLKKWDMDKESGKTSSNYVLVKYWNNVVKRNKLNTDMVVQLWSFRVQSKLCLALVRL